MDHMRPLTPCLIGRGTVANFRDMLRVLETIESLRYRYVVHGEVMAEGEAALVKLMADGDSSTLLVNGCLFLNVASFHYLDFEQNAEDSWFFRLHGDGALLELTALPDTTPGAAEGRPHLLSEEMPPDFDALIALDDEEDEE